MTTRSRAIRPGTVGQIVDTFNRLDQLGHHPELDATDYVPRWWDEEDHCTFRIGCPDWPDRPALIFAIEAARLICCAPTSTERQLIVDLFRLATDEINTHTNGETSA